MYRVRVLSKVKDGVQLGSQQVLMSLIAEGSHHQGLSTLCPQITTRYIHNTRLGGWALTCALRHMYGLSIQGSPTPFLSSKQLVQDEVVNHTHHYLVYIQCR